MTILIGTIHDGKAIIGADTLWAFSEDFVRVHKQGKFISTLPYKLKHPVLIATSGQERFTQIFEKAIKDAPDLLEFRNRAGVIQLAEALQIEVSKSGIGEADTNELPMHNMEFMLASALTKSIWVIEDDYSVLEFDDHICSGSGCFLGESAMLALKKQNINGREAVKTALETVMALHPYCGGSADIHEIELK